MHLVRFTVLLRRFHRTNIIRDWFAVHERITVEFLHILSMPKSSRFFFEDEGGKYMIIFIDHKIRCLCWMPWMLHVMTSQLIIAGDGASIQGDFIPGAGQWKTSDVMFMKIFGLTNKSDRISTKNSFHGCYFVFLCICCNIRNSKCTAIGPARFHFTCNTFVQKKMYCINTNITILFFYVLLTLQQISDFYL